MRIFIFLDPTNKRGTKTEYTKFRQELLKNGFICVQPEIYMRITQNRKSCDKFFKKLSPFVPKTGRITAYKITEKQFSKLVYMTGKPSKQEEIIGSNSVIQL